MNWDAIGAVGEIVGALAVVLSLIYLATQIRVSNRVAQRDSRTKLLDLGREIWSGAAGSPELAKVRVKLRKVNPELSPEEREIARDWAQHLYFTISAVGIAFESDTIGESTMNAYLLGIESILEEYPGIAPILGRMPVNNGIKEGFNLWWDQVLELFAKAQNEQLSESKT